MAPVDSTDDNDHRDAQASEDKEADVAEQLDRAKDFLAGLLDAFAVEGYQIEVIEGEEDNELRVHGEDLGLLIGPRGQTLTAVQDLTRLAVQREGREGRLHLDIAGYRERRREALARFTGQVIEEVLSSGQARALEPMNAPDRKVVHDTAGAFPGVTTVSEGEDPYRRVVIRPAG